MKKRILITGVSGTGKSTIGKTLAEMGFETYDLENIDDLFGMYHKGTKEIFEGYNNANPDDIKGAEWICDAQKLKLVINSQKSNIAFYYGIASNIDDILPLFNNVIMLQPTARVLNERLKNREGTDDIGNNQEGRDVILGWKDWWEDQMSKKGALIIKANDPPNKVVLNILNTLQLPIHR